MSLRIIVPDQNIATAINLDRPAPKRPTTRSRIAELQDPLTHRC